MSPKYNLEDLLNLALGTPEVGAVNFNCLYEVIHEILKHLGIAGKSTAVAEDFEGGAQLLSGRCTPLAEVQEEDLETKNTQDSVSNSANQSNELLKDPTKDGISNEGITGSADDNSKLNKKSSNGGITEEEKGDKAGINGGNRSKPSSAEMERPTRRLSMSPVASRRSSNASAGFADRRLSSERRLSNMVNPNETASQDVILVNRSLDRRDSKTPAGDMWQILNINRRLEAAEATIEGMTSLVDNISTDLSELRESIDKKFSERMSEMKKEDTSDVTAIVMQRDDQRSAVEERRLEELSKSLKASIKEIEDRIKMCATKQDIGYLCTISTVEALIEERFGSQPVPKASEEQPPRRKESRSKMLHEAISRIMKLEEGAIFLNDEFVKLKSLLDSKADKRDEEAISNINAEIKRLNDEVLKQQSIGKDLKSLQASVNKITEESESLRYITDQAVKEHNESYKNISKIERELIELTDTVHTKMGSSSSNAQVLKSEQEAISKLRTAMSSLQEEHRLLDDEVLRINKAIEESKRKFLLTDEALGDVKAKKLDKDSLGKILEVKADKSLLDDKISQNHFDSCMVHFDRNIQDIMQRVDGQETIWKKFFCKIEAKLEQKINQSELEKIKDSLELQLKTIKVKQPEPAMPEDGAAGFRKPILRNFHCISCDRPLDMVQDDAVPTLPICQALPGNRAIRPYTTFELEQIRKHVRGTGSNKGRFELAQEREKLQRQLLRLCGAHDLDGLALQSSRACGGSHTLLDPQKRALVKTTMVFREDSIPVTAPSEPVSEGEVMGRDGHIYRGRHEHLPPLIQKEHPSSRSNNDIPIMARPSIQQSKPDDYSNAGYMNQPIANETTA